LVNPYTAIARYRRRFYAARPDLQRHLTAPVVSVGNVAVGGRGKTPLVAAVAALLRDAGERPAVLTRGYARARYEDGVVVVRDPDGIRADVDRAGDEPMMLARALDGVAVLTSPNRYTAGRLAEHHFGCTVHVLDDGFQHFSLHRDADIVLVSDADVRDPRTLPFGRLREPLDALACADAVLTLADVNVRTDARIFRAHAIMERPALEPGCACVALAGIAQPGRFFSGLRAMGWPIAREIAFPDHHRYSARDVARLVRTAHANGSDLIVTTEKDLVRLLPYRPLGVRLAVAPFRIQVEPAPEFTAWLMERIERSHASGVGINGVPASERVRGLGAQPPGKT
jgi:tetraacyldisaccharide 4'-kinase